MIRILQISNKAPYPANDGSSIAILNMAKGFIANGAELHLLTINTKKHFKADHEVPADLRRQTHYASVYRNTNTSISGAFLNLFSTDSYFVSRFFFGRFRRKISEILKTNQFDIVQIEGLFLAPYIETIRKNSRAKIVLRAHNVEHVIWERHIIHEKFSLRRFYLKIQNNRLRKCELSAFSQVDAIVPISEIDAGLIRRLGCKVPVYSCITGVDVKSYSGKSLSVQRPATVFYFGSMDWLPNQEAAKWFLENCWKKIHEQVPGAKFIIAGRGMPLEFFHITAPNVQIVENVEDGRAFFEQHEIMIVPILSGSGLRIKIVEGMAYGKPIVSTTIGAEGTNTENNSNILIADTPDEFAEKVILLLRDKKLRERIGANAASFALTHFDNYALVSGLLSFYKKLLND